MENSKEKKISDFIYVCYKWKKLILLIFAIFVSGSVIISLLLPNEYKSVSVLMIPPQSPILLGMTGMASSNPVASISTKLLGVGTSAEDSYLGLLNSRSAINSAIKKFRLKKYYDLKTIDETIKRFQQDITFEMNEYGMIEISVINEDPKTSANIANYFGSLLDSIYIKVSLDNAKNVRKFIEQRYLKVIDDIKIAEEEFQIFQKKYGLFVLPEQLEVAMKATAELEAKIFEASVELSLAQNLSGNESPQFELALKKKKILEGKLDELKNDEKLSFETIVLVPFKNMPEVFTEYYRLYREIEIQNKILTVVLPIYEQAKFEEVKNIPTISVIDYAVPADRKSSPKRSLIVISVSFLALILSILVTFFFDGKLKRPIINNPVDEKLVSFTKKLVKVFKVE